MSISRGNNAVHYGPEWRVTFPVSFRQYVYDIRADEMVVRRRQAFIWFGKIPYVRFGFHLRVAIL